MEFKIQIPDYMAVTGRINNWIKNPRDFHPASCTVINVNDSLFRGEDSISDAVTFTIYGLAHGAGVAVNLSDLRANGVRNNRGLVASGATSFGKIFSMVNEVVRRGGVYKNGAITLYINADSDDLLEYLYTKDLPWAKRAVYLNKEMWDNMTNNSRKCLAQKVNNGEVWLAKPQYDKNGTRIYSNVCLEVLLPSRGTCMLSSVNLGQVKELADIPGMMMKCMAVLCRIHANTGVDRDGVYLSPKEDRQVGLGVIGLANMLAVHKIKYKDFVVELERQLGDPKAPYPTNMFDATYYAVRYLIEGYEKSAKVAKQHGMERAFAIAPTASMSYRYTDVEGYTTAPEISPPLDLEVDRDSDTFGVETFQYNPDCEIASEVGWSVQWKLLNAWQTMMDRTGLAHAISSNLWTTFVVDEDWIENEFLPSPIKTTYYRLQIDQEALDKSEVVTEGSNEKKLRDIYFDPGAVTRPEDDPQYCEACAG